MPVRFQNQVSVCVAAALMTVAIARSVGQDQPAATARAKKAESPGDDRNAAARNRMVQRHLVERGLKNTRVLEAFRTVPRHRFLPPGDAAAGVRRRIDPDRRRPDDHAPL